MSFTPGRTVRLSALALATGTLVATAATGAGATTEHRQDTSPLTYAGNTGSSVVSLDLTLPGGSTLGGALSALPAPLNSIIDGNGTIDLSLLNQTGALSHDATGKQADVATSTSTFAGGALGALLTQLSQGGLVLNQTITSTLANPKAMSSQALGAITNNLPAQLQGLLGLQVPGLDVSSAASPLATTGNSVLAGVDLGKIADALPAGTLDALETALGTVVTQLQSGLSTANGALGSALGQITGPLSGVLSGTPLAGLGTALTNDSADLKTALDELTDELPGIIANIEDGSIVTLQGLTTTHSVTEANGVQTSTVASKLAGVKILGGLVNLEGFSNSLTTQAGGKAGTSKVNAQPNLAKVDLGTNDELSVVLGSISSVEGTIAKLGNDTLAGAGLSGTPLANLTAALNTVTGGLTTLTDALNSALGAAGVSVQQDAVTQNVVAPDGTSAKGALSGLQIIVDPLSKLPIGTLPLAQRGSAAAATPPLLDINVGGLVASSAAVAPAAPTSPTTPTTPTTPGQPTLAFTGADLPLTAGVATVLLAGGAALVIRRRRSGSEI